jgi:two-component system response regulator NreC
MPGYLHLAAAPSTAGPYETPSIRVVLGDDHNLMRRNLRLLLDREDGLDVVAEAADVPTAMRHVHGHRPHVLVLDLSTTNGSSLEAIRQLRQQVPETRIIVLSVEEDPAFAQQALDAGAIGFVLKDSADGDLARAVRNAVRGERYVSRRVAVLLRAMRTSAKRDNLTEREVEVLRLVALGHTSAEIAAKLHLSVRTVETHRARIHRKLGLSTRVELVRYALRRGLFGA